jgi:orotate phosphoribosyltransferase
MTRTQEQWIVEYQKRNALWISDEDPKRPHARLTSGKHSNGFFNSQLVITDSGLMQDAAFDLLEKFILDGGEMLDVEEVVGPQTGATKLAEFIAKQLGNTTRRFCSYASPAKSDKDGIKSMVFTSEEVARIRGHTILLCEDVISTGGSVDLASDAIEKAGGTILPYVLVLVNRSGQKEARGRKILSLIDRPMPMWLPADCQLCPFGSEAIPAKGDNWARLNDVY